MEGKSGIGGLRNAMDGPGLPSCFLGIDTIELGAFNHKWTRCSQ
jgi:hypothetical protein